MNDYTGLVSTIKSYLHRGDVAAMTPRFIQLAETRFNRNLRVRQMEKPADIVLTDGVGTLPNDWLAFSQGPLSGERPYTYVPADQWNDSFYRETAGLYFTIHGDQFKGSRDYSGEHNVSGFYYSRIPALSDAQPINWLLDDGFDLYLYGALVEATPYIKEDGRIETWKQFLQIAMQDLQISDDKSMYTGPLTVGMPV